MRGRSANGRSTAYAVAWRGANGVASGSLQLRVSEIVLRGSGTDGTIVRKRVPLEEISAVRIGRAAAERVQGERSVVLELRSG